MRSGIGCLSGFRIIPNPVWYKIVLITILSIILSSTLLKAQPKVKTGLENLRDMHFKPLEGKRVGLITNPTGVDGQLHSTIDILFQGGNFKLSALFSPEHGIRGEYSAGARVDSGIDRVTGLPVYSLYGKNRKPSALMLKDIDVLVYDIQDIGSRSYTFISTMGLAMEAAAENGKEFIVLDRPNPLGGIRIEGPVTEPGFISFVGQYPIPYLYGLTCGELAKLLNGERMLSGKVKCRLLVIPMEGWKRTMLFSETELPWVPSSPHIPHEWSPQYYAISGIVGELNPNMVGIGYTLPFETFAMPWINAEVLADAMNGLNLPGLQFRAIHFKPYYMALKDSILHGVQVYITDPKVAMLTPVQFYFLEIIHQLYPEHNLFQGTSDRIAMFDKVAGSSDVRKIFTSAYTFRALENFWNKDVKTFRTLAAKYYLYP